MKKKFLASMAGVVAVLLGGIMFVGCGAKADVTLAADNVAKFGGEVAFNNNDTLKIKQNGDKYVITGTANLMTAEQKTAFGTDATNYVSLKVNVGEKFNTGILKRTVTKNIVKGNLDGDYFIYLVLDTAAAEQNYTFELKDSAAKTYKTITIDVKSVVAATQDPAPAV